MGQSSSVSLENLLESDFWCTAEWQGGGEQVFGGRQKLLCRQDHFHVLITVDSDSGLELRWNIVLEFSILPMDLCSVFQLQFSGAYISAHCSHLSHGVTNKPPKNTHKKQRASRFVLFCSFLWFEWGRFGKNRALVVECVGTQQPFGLKADRGQ